jgi:hypothetical protein
MLSQLRKSFAEARNIERSGTVDAASKLVTASNEIIDIYKEQIDTLKLQLNVAREDYGDMRKAYLVILREHSDCLSRLRQKNLEEEHE